MPLIKFDISLYKKEAIENAIAVFSNHAHFRFLKPKERKTLLLEMKALGREKERTVIGEFCNYVLGVTKQCL